MRRTRRKSRRKKSKGAVNGVKEEDVEDDKVEGGGG